MASRAVLEDVRRACSSNDNDNDDGDGDDSDDGDSDHLYED